MGSSGVLLVILSVQLRPLRFSCVANAVHANVPPHLQVECHPYLPADEMLALCHERGMRMMAYCPLASGQAGLLQDPVLVPMAARHGVTVSELVLRWHMQRGVIPVPKSRTPDRIATNLAVPDFELSPEDLCTIAGLGRNYHVCPDPEAFA